MNQSAIENRGYGVFSGIQKMTRIQLLYYVRTVRFLFILIITLLVDAIVLGLDFYTGLNTIKISSVNSNGLFSSIVSNLPILIVPLIGALYGGDAVSLDTGTNAGYFMMTTPVNKISMLIGRFIAALILGTVSISILYITGAGLSQYLYGNITSLALESFGFAVLGLAATIAFSFFLGSLVKSPLLGLIVSIIVLLLVFPIIDGSLSLTSIEPWFSISYGLQIISNIFEPITHVSVRAIGHTGITITTFNAYPHEAAFILLGYTIIGLVLSAIIFLRKEVSPQ
ncbi:ABC transporter permease [Caldiplasma sukawensis]